MGGLKASEIDPLPSCDDVKPMVERMFQKKVGDTSRSIVVTKLESTSAISRICTGMFAENFVDDKAWWVRYEIARSDKSGQSVGYSLRIISQHR
jgi:hypothetical protein